MNVAHFANERFARLSATVLLLIAMWVMPGVACAQSARPFAVIHSLTASTGDVLAIRSATYPSFSPRQTSSNITTSLTVGANIAHDVFVRLEDESSAAIVYVREASGAWQRLTSHAPVRIAAGALPGVMPFTVSWRAEGVKAVEVPSISYLVLPASAPGAPVAVIATRHAN